MGDAADVDSDLSDLQKKYRAIDGDRKSFSEESQTHLRKQRCAAASPLAQTPSRRPTCDAHHACSSTLHDFTPSASHCTQRDH